MGVVEVLLCSWGISSLSGIIFVIPEYNGHCASFKYPMATISLLYTSDVVDDLLLVVLGGRRLIRNLSSCSLRLLILSLLHL